MASSSAACMLGPARACTPRRSPAGAPRRPCRTRSRRRSRRRSPSRCRAGRAEDAGRGSGRVRGAVTTLRHPPGMPPTPPAPEPVIRTRRRGRIRPLEQIPVWHGFETIAEPGGATDGGEISATSGIDALLAGLNADQREAVTHGDGPLLIVAGAGTGKTQAITRRIAWLIASKRAKPEQVLALTFTDKAAAEMESRVDVLVPYGLVGATITTFHAFCDRLVREHAVELGLTSQLRVENPIEILVFLRERILELPLERYRPLGTPDAHLKALVRVFDRARDEDVSPEAYRAFTESLMA